MYNFIEQALSQDIDTQEDTYTNNTNKNENEINTLNTFNYQSEKVQKYLRKFFKLYGYEKNFSNSELINSEDIEEIPSISCKNKIIQVLIKMQISTNQNFNNSKILIHCSLGMSRSPTLAIMYLMKKIKISFELVKIFP